MFKEPEHEHILEFGVLTATPKRAAKESVPLCYCKRCERWCWKTMKINFG